MDLIGNVAAALLAGGLLLGAYHYVVYPAAVVAASRLFPKTRRPNADLPPVTLVIAAYNEETVIADKMRNSFDLDYPGLEIIVVADGSDDRTVERLLPFHDRGAVVLHEPTRRGKSAALNRGAATAAGEIVVFSDANAMYRRDAIRELTRGFSDSSVGGVSGCKIVRPRTGQNGRDSGFGRSEGLYWRYENVIRLAESRLGCTVATVGEIFAVRRSAFRPLPAGVVNDDSYLALDLLRRGYDVLYMPGAIAEESASVATQDERLRRRRISAGRWLILSDFRLWPVRRPFVMLALLSHKAMRLAMPFAMAAALAGNLVLAARGIGGTGIMLLLAAQLAFYGGSVAGRRESAGNGALPRLARLCHFVVASNVSIALGFVDWTSRKQNVLWAKAAR